MNTLYLLPHLGLGDMIICNGMIRVLASRHGRIVVPCKWHNRPGVIRMLRDVEKLRLLGVKNDAEAILWSDRFEKGASDVIRLGIFSRQPLRQDWDRQMYEQAGVDFEERWKGFFIPAAAENPNDNTPFAHEDRLRGFSINRKLLPYGARFVQKLPTALDAVGWLSHAPEIHCIDSAFLCLADSIPTAASRLVFHRYARPQGLPPTLRKNWEVLE